MANQKKVDPPLLFNNTNVTRTSSKKHLGIILDTQELGLESLQSRCWYIKLGMFYKIFKSNTFSS